MKIKKYTLMTATALTFVSASASASASTFAPTEYCNNEYELEQYQYARENILPQYDNIDSNGKQAIIFAYRTIEGAATDYASSSANNPIPVDIITNTTNFAKALSHDDNERLEGYLGIYTNVVGKISPQIAEKVAEMARSIISGLSAKKVSQVMDETNQLLVNRARTDRGCRPYNLPTYTPSTPYTPFYQKNGSCINFGFSQYKSSMEVEEIDYSPGRCSYSAIYTPPNSTIPTSGTLIKLEFGFNQHMDYSEQWINSKIDEIRNLGVEYSVSYGPEGMTFIGYNATDREYPYNNIEAYHKNAFVMVEYMTSPQINRIPINAMGESIKKVFQSME